MVTDGYSFRFRFTWLKNWMSQCKARLIYLYLLSRYIAHVLHLSTLSKTSLCVVSIILIFWKALVL